MMGESAKPSFEHQCHYLSSLVIFNVSVNVDAFKAQKESSSCPFGMVGWSYACWEDVVLKT